MMSKNQARFKINRVIRAVYPSAEYNWYYKDDLESNIPILHLWYVIREIDHEMSLITLDAYMIDFKGLFSPVETDILVTMEEANNNINHFIWKISRKETDDDESPPWKEDELK